MLIHIDSSRDDPLTDQIVHGIQRLVDARALRPGSRLPSIRQFAAAHDVSKFTAVQAYDRLVASGHIESRQGAGFFVCKPAQFAPPVNGGLRLDRATDVLWLIHSQSQETRFKYLPGVGWLPPKWLEHNGLDRALRDLARRETRSFIAGYGDAQGFVPLREDVSRRFAEFAIEAPPDQILLTNGHSDAIDLVGRYLIRPDDVVFVDDPGYFRVFGHLRALGATVEGVPRNSAGPDLEALERLARAHKPRLFLTASIVQNPTGLSTSQRTAFRLLQLAEQHDFYIIEDDLDGPFHPHPPPRLASLDQLNRVVYVSGFSKSISPRLRVGFMAGHRDLVRDLVDLKLLTQAATSELAERLAHMVIASGHYRKHRASLMRKLERARDRALRGLEAVGLGPPEDDTHGMFAWVNVPGVTDTAHLAEAATKRNMLLAPGTMFTPGMRPMSKMRFNVSFCQSDEFFRALESLLNEYARGSGLRAGSA